MANNNVYYWLDIFCPISYFKGESTGESDYADNTVYLILNFCLKNSDNNLQEYLMNQGKGFTIEALKNSLTDKEIANSDLPITPVPPPLLTKIKMKFGTTEYTLNSVDEGKLGYKFQSVEEKLDFIFTNGSFVTCEAAHLKDHFNSIFRQFYEGGDNKEYKIQSRQHKELKDWFIAFLTEIEKTYREQELLEKIRNNWSGADKDFWKNIKDKTEENNAFRSYLISYLDYVLENDFNDDFFPPSFKYTKQQLLNIKKDSSGLGYILSTIDNYVELLFNTFSKILEKPKEEKPSEKCREQLQRFFGMGERLFIPAPTSLADKYHFMKVCDDKDPDGIISLNGNQHLVTNAFSLSGQVIRGLELIESDLSLARYPGETIKADDLISEKLGILINDGQSDNWINLLDDEDIKSSLRAAVKNVVDNNKNSFEKSISVTDRMTVLEIDEDDKKPPVEKELVKEKVQYVPVTGYGIPELKINDEDRTLFKVPEFILDRLDKSPRMSLNSSSTDEKKLITLQSQRIFLKSDEVALEIKDPFLKNEPMPTIAESFQPAVFLQVKISKQKLPDIKIEGDTASGYIYKVSKKLEDQQSTPLPQQGFRNAIIQAVQRKAERWYFGLSKNNGSVELPIESLTVKDIIDEDELIEFFTFEGERFFNERENSTEVNLLIYEKEPTLNSSSEPLFKQYTLHDFFNGILSKETISDPKKYKPKPFLALNNIFDFKFNQSVNAFSKFLQVELRRGNRFKDSTINDDSGKSYNPVLEDFPNFNELRLSLKISESEEIQVNPEDGIIPSSTSKFQKHFSSVTYGYEVTHRFSQELEGSSDSESVSAESQRFMLYKNTSKSSNLKGSLEHQYGHRLAVVDSSEENLILGYSAPIKNIANLIGMEIPKKNGEGDKNQQRLKDTYAVGYELIENDNDEIESLVVFLNPEYFKHQLSSKETIADDAKNYREIYEAILDFVNNNHQLVLECWTFDNMLNPPSLEDAAHPEKANQWPSVVDNMRPMYDEIRIPQGINFLSNVVDEKFNTFKDYKIWVDELANSQTLKEEIQLQDIIANKIKESNLIRLRLDVERKDSKTNTVKSLFDFTQELPDWDIKPMKVENNENIFNPLKPNAKQYLRDFLSNITLGQDSFDKASAYIYAKQAQSNIGGKRENKNNREELFGETLRFITFPSEEARNKTKTDLLYIPYAFVPLKIHQEIGDATSTLEFAQYIIRVLNALAYPERESQPLKEIINLGLDENKNKHDLLKYRRDARKILKGVARLLAKLLDHIHTKGTAENEYTPYVNQLSGNKTFKKELRKIFSSLLERNPSLFYTAKGFAIGLFPGDQSEFDHITRDLYSLQITKEISDKAKNGAQPFEQTRILFKQFFSPEDEDSDEYFDESIRLFVETLDDKIYDNEFQISADKTARNFLVDKPDTRRPIKAVQGRTVEDIIERQNFFSFQNYDRGNNKAAQVNIKHFNPNWKNGKGEEFYLLPSRKPPVTPVPVSILLDEKEKPEELQGGIKPFNKYKDGKKVWSHLKEKLESPYIVSEDVKYEKKYISYVNPIYFNTDFNPKHESLEFIDSYINYFYFVVEGDEESELNNDDFAIYLEAWNQNTNKNRVNAESELFSKLLEQFRYYSTDPKNRKKEKPEKLNIESLLSEQDGLFKTLEKEKLLDPNEDLWDDRKNFFLFRCSGDNCTLDPPKDDRSQNRIVAIYVFKKSNEDEQKPNSFLIKIAVLTNTTLSHKCQMKVIRNARDFNKDGISDINQRFVMNSNLSPVVDYGIQHLEYDYVLITDNSYEWPEALKYLKTKISLEQYFQNPTISESLIKETIQNSYIKDKDDVQVQVVLSKRHGNAFITSYGRPEVKNIKAVNLAYSDKIDEYIRPSSELAQIGKDLQKQLIEVVTESSFSWFIAATWFRKDHPSIPIFTINWQLKWNT